MPLIAATGIRMHHGGPLILDGVNASIERGARVGLIGRNGCGKSTLLQILRGSLSPTEGSVVHERGIRLGYQAQELVPVAGRTVLEEMREAFSSEREREEDLRRIEQALAAQPGAEERSRLMAEYGRLQAAQEHAGVYDVDHRIGTLLTSLGLPEATWHQPLEGFSGGERNVIGLARVLLAEPDVLLLDEPSNHLDMEGVEWFIGFVQRTRAAVVMVSHDRHLLDETAQEIWELRGGRLTTWTGNYGAYRQQKAEADARLERQFKVQQRLVERIEFQARRLMDMANAYDDPGQARRAKSMLRRIERMERVERPEGPNKRFGVTLTAGARHGRIALTIDDFRFAYGERVLFDGAKLEIEYGERVCLVGANGSGKSTLFRKILEEGAWENPTLRLGKAVRLGDYRQLREDLDPAERLDDYAIRVTRLLRNEAVGLLHRFRFTREDLERTIGTLSGGEKSRLQLARLVHEKVNFLLLDEPTNHLDIASCEQLEEMLMAFDGTLLVISHDRWFLDKLVERVVEVEDGRLVDHRMTFRAWWQARQATGGRRAALEDRTLPGSDKQAARNAFETRREQQRELNRLRNRQRELEERIAQLEARVQQLESALETAFAPGRDPAQGARIVEDLEQGRVELTGLYDEWAAVAEALGA